MWELILLENYFLRPATSKWDLNSDDRRKTEVLCRTELNDDSF
ncbi:hypothetical protein LEP1GSC166_2923 [Leptospira kirschneri]|nr:hypothetical protein LEP1GSC198_3185 [Leptospira kirschneri str. JB]EMK03051.1 hypothetical protein LEP1GSC166_2923 [Leptospira kirschneri]